MDHEHPGNSSNTRELALEFAVATDIGCKRANNEDSFGYDAALGIYAVCDGMGGMAAGEVASATAVQALLERFGAGAIAGEAKPGTETVPERIYQAIAAANLAVRELAAASGKEGMGTTLVCAALEDARVVRIVIGNVGDSRAYFVRGGECRQITTDHSLVGEQLRHGLITPEVAAVSNLQSVITRAIGAAAKVEPDLYETEIRPGDMILLATDGLTRYVEAVEISSILSSGKDLQRICQTLIDAAKTRGGADNITCLALRVTA